MPWSKVQKNRPKIVRKRLADGTIKTYEYERHKATPQAPKASNSLAMLIQAYQISPQWRRLSDSTKDRYSRYLRPLTPFLDRPFVELDRDLIIDLRNRIDAKDKPAAANAFVRAVSALFAWGMDNRSIKLNPTLRIKPLPGGHLPAWTPDITARALDELPEHLKRLVLLALFTGQRRADLCRLAWSNYDGQRIRLTQGKTGTPLVIPVHPVLRDAMATWERKATTILVNARGRPWKPGSASHGMKLAIDRLGFPAGWNIHGLRKLAAANLAEAGCSALEIAAITGHRTLSMISLYTRGADQERMAGAAIHRLQFGKARGQ